MYSRWTDKQKMSKKKATMEFLMKIRNDWIGYKHYETLTILMKLI